MFKEVEAVSYAENKIKAGVKVEEYAKTARIQARVAVEGEQIVTQMKDGHIETKNTAKEGDVIATNPAGEQYIIPAATFVKKYEVDPVNPEQYRPKGGAQQFIHVDEDISFKAPWGEEMHIKAGGVLNVSGLTTGDVYGIQKDEFKNTYAKCTSDGTPIKSSSVNTDRLTKRANEGR